MDFFIRVLLYWVPAIFMKVDRMNRNVTGFECLAYVVLNNDTMTYPIRRWTLLASFVCLEVFLGRDSHHPLQNPFAFFPNPSEKACLMRHTRTVPFHIEYFHSILWIQYTKSINPLNSNQFNHGSPYRSIQSTPTHHCHHQCHTHLLHQPRPHANQRILRRRPPKIRRNPRMCRPAHCHIRSMSQGHAGCHRWGIQDLWIYLDDSGCFGACGYF